MSSCPNDPPTDRPFSPGDRTYYVSDERLRAFKALSPEQKLRWQEEVSTFLRLARASRAEPQEKAEKQGILNAVNHTGRVSGQ